MVFLSLSFFFFLVLLLQYFCPQNHEGQHSFQNLTENQNLFSLKFVFLVTNCNVTIRIVPGLPGSKIEGHSYHKTEMTAPEKQQIPRTHCYSALTYLSFLIDLLCIELCFSVVHKAHPVKVRRGREQEGRAVPESLCECDLEQSLLLAASFVFISASCVPQGIRESFPLPTLGH